ncbi:hypothetical protein [Streptomyces sp. NPDC002516]
MGRVEVVLLPDLPDHQVLPSRRAAEIHTVVLDGHRGEGVGAALPTAAEKAAAEHGVPIGVRRRVDHRHRVGVQWLTEPGRPSAKRLGPGSPRTSAAASSPMTDANLKP